MPDIKMTVAMVCAYMKLSTHDLAKAAGINELHLDAVRAGRARMTADDLIGICDASGLEMHRIETNPAKQ